ncbi:PEP-CTERM domain protein [Syntrophotalea acetylenivorans]|uniref:PEP-CTERM domain protein n=1 Tax=Syntrophotalea acetylenivorans TaxID=1842532 RepID=A0A1L3GKD9_9BACT|nr:choice-of-anchor L domain-containing protein [Syntrophotalea acetylenivorans]APG26413.1 PEP-CTERM domain protein [Syntrophotalea acetylenivorans]
MKAIVSTLYTLLFFTVTTNVMAMSITSMTTPGDLAQNMVGAGVSISNITYTGYASASGYFTGGTAAGIGIESGIVLTSGLAANLNGTTNTSDDIDSDNDLPGYAPLNNLIPGFTTYDATILSFDFVSTGDAAYFNYVFGSEEYNEWVNSDYNDVFGFFFNGTEVTDNVALIPGTNTAVSINNINSNSNTLYYNDNDNDDAPGAYPFEYDGFTHVFTASLLGLTAGETYHLDLAIADAGDWSLDSGVFIQTGSFSNTPVEPNVVPEPGTFALVGAGILGLCFIRRKKD